MGTRALDAREWLVVDDAREQQLRLKARLLTDVPDVVRASTPGAEDAEREVLALVAEATGEVVPDVAAPLEAAARIVQEDLVILQRLDGAWTVTAGVVCFPTHWTVADKIGRPLADVHSGVAHYERELRERVDRFHDRLAADRPVWRRNWFVSPTDELHLPAYPPGMVLPDSIEPDGSPMWIRSERQTLRRLPRTDAIVFTIRVQLAPLGVLSARPDLAARMLAAVRSWDDVKRGYTSTGRVLLALEEWLADLTGAA